MNNDLNFINNNLSHPIYREREILYSTNTILKSILITITILFLLPFFSNYSKQHIHKNLKVNLPKIL